MLTIHYELEAQFGFLPDGASNVTAQSYDVAIGITDLRNNPVYSKFSNWIKLLFLGVVPFALLLGFNLEVLLK